MVGMRSPRLSEKEGREVTLDLRQEFSEFSVPQRLVRKARYTGVPLRCLAAWCVPVHRLE